MCVTASLLPTGIWHFGRIFLRVFFGGIHGLHTCQSRSMCAAFHAPILCIVCCHLPPVAYGQGSFRSCCLIKNGLSHCSLWFPSLALSGLWLHSCPRVWAFSVHGFSAACKVDPNAQPLSACVWVLCYADAYKRCGIRCHRHHVTIVGRVISLQSWNTCTVLTSCCFVVCKISSVRLLLLLGASCFRWQSYSYVRLSCRCGECMCFRLPSMRLELCRLLAPKCANDQATLWDLSLESVLFCFHPLHPD